MGRDHPGPQLTELQSNSNICFLRTKTVGGCKSLFGFPPARLSRLICHNASIILRRCPSAHGSTAHPPDGSVVALPDLPFAAPVGLRCRRTLAVLLPSAAVLTQERHWIPPDRLPPGWERWAVCYCVW